MTHGILCAAVLFILASSVLCAQPVLVRTFTADSAVTAVAVNRPGSVVAFTTGRTVHVRNVADGSGYTLEHVGEGRITRLEISPLGDELLAVRSVGAPFVWSLTSRTRRYDLSFGSSAYEVPWASYTGDAIHTVSHDSTHSFWYAEDGKLSHARRNPTALYAGALNYPKHSIAVGGADSVVYVWDIFFPIVHVSLRTYQPVHRMAYRLQSRLGAPDWLLVAGTDSIIEYDQYWDRVRVVYVGSPIYDIVTTLTNDRTVIVVDTSAYILFGGTALEQAYVLNAHGAATTTASWNVDGRVLITGGADSTAKVWTFGPAAVDDATDDTTITLVPNPATSSTVLRLPSATAAHIMIVDPIGRMHAMLESGGRTEIEIDLRSMARGVYTVIASTGDVSWSEKLVVR